MTISLKKEFDHPTLRFAGLNDIDGIIELAKKLYAESPYKVFQLDLSKVRAGLEKFIIEGGKNHLALLSHDNGRTVGALVAYAYEPLFSNERIAVEVLWYLDPSFRTSTRGVEMMNAYEYWAKGVGCKVAQYGILSSSPSGMEKLFDKRGLELTERIYQKVF